MTVANLVFLELTLAEVAIRELSHGARAVGQTDILRHARKTLRQTEHELRILTLDESEQIDAYIKVSVVEELIDSFDHGTDWPQWHQRMDRLFPAVREPVLTELS